jgi:hypothetical protein
MATTAGAPKPAAKPRNAGNVRSLADLAGDGDDSDEDRPVETFIGGAKRRVLSSLWWSLCTEAS